VKTLTGETAPNRVKANVGRMLSEPPIPLIAEIIRQSLARLVIAGLAPMFNMIMNVGSD
jgi:hypothetical protein